jgi:hypothetical protein
MVISVEALGYFLFYDSIVLHGTINSYLTYYVDIIYEALSAILLCGCSSQIGFPSLGICRAMGAGLGLGTAAEQGSQ